MAETKAGGEAQQGQGEAAARPEKKIKKMEAVRRSLAKLGTDATPREIQADVKKRFKIDMTTDHISTYKGDIAKKARQREQAANQPEAEAAVSAAPREKPARAAAAAAQAANGRGAAIPLEDILAVKALVQRVGADHLRALIAAFER